MSVSSPLDRVAVGVQADSADTDETLLSKSAEAKLGLAGVLATIASGLTSQTVLLKDGSAVFARLDVTPGNTATLLLWPNVVPLAGDLVFQATSTDVEVTAWAADIT